MCITVLDSLELKQFVDLRLLSRRLIKQIHVINQLPFFVANFYSDLAGKCENLDISLLLNDLTVTSQTIIYQGMQRCDES